MCPGCYGCKGISGPPPPNTPTKWCLRPQVCRRHVAEQPEIRIRQRQIQQLFRRSPSQRFVLGQGNLAAPFTDEVSAQPYKSVSRFTHEPTHRNGDPELFGKLPRQRLFRRFTGFNLAAGKLPAAAVSATRFTSHDQQFIVTDEQPTNDLDHAAPVTARIRSARRFKSSRSRANSGAIS